MTEPEQAIRIALIGYRGTGKTTVAKGVAKRLDLDWYDADAEVEQRAGKSIKQIFADDGERTFRDLEVETIANMLARDAAVLSLGGGAVMRDETRQAIKGCTVVWLKARPTTIHARMTADIKTSEQRPNLTVGGLAEIQSLLTQREPVYQACADYIVETDDKSADQVTEEIVCLLQ